MIGRLLRRCALGLLTLAGVSVLAFLLLFAVPRDPAAAMCPKNCDTARLERIREEWGLSEPVPVQYLSFASRLFTGEDGCAAPCLGRSYVTGEQVSAMLARALPVTASVVLPAAVLWVTSGVLLGTVAAARPRSAADRLIGALSLAGLALPLYLVGAVLLLILVYGTAALPQPGWTAPSDDPAQWASGLLLPWVTLGAMLAPGYTRLARAQVGDALGTDFVRTAEAKGLTGRAVVGRHALRASAGPLATLAALDVGAALGGTVITEITFGLNGLGRTVIEAVRTDDLPVVLGAVLLGAVFVIGANTIVDGLQAVIDPRLRR
ncbi:peptide/nickel transport system permease protein [Catenuloplanes nepalensis]|uniref:Peptide/nickel transport system permease protein n=1 Tax=Catenuloplanes nepalensis TaxID=587533 RepID=A0ABT9MW36_9ACTN|nr:ABC transporter permease [Catenuloplanes nepalensis]MDP9795658.1 peptide/nickel transport system permease protein [Catenuloplanes nepalensis]